MAKTNPTERYFQIVKRINSGDTDLTEEEWTFFITTSPEIDESKIQALVAASEEAKNNPEKAVIDSKILRDGMVAAIQKTQSTPFYREQMLKVAQKAQAGKISEKLSQGIKLVLGGVDIATSASQIKASESAARQSKRPTRPAVPQRDIMLEQALRGAQENVNDTERAIAPVRQEIQDQYLNDIQGAKTASTGQAGAYGAYRQLAANRRNKSAMQLAPIQDEIRRGQQARVDSLLGQRLDETQNMFQNQASLYPHDLQQYSFDQRAISELGQQGRESLRNSLYNMGGKAAGAIGDAYSQNRYNKYRNQAIAAGLNADNLVENRSKLEGYTSTMTSDDTPGYWDQLYINGR